MKILYKLLLVFSMVESVVVFTFMSASSMRFREPVKKRIIVGLIVMLCGIGWLCTTLFTKGIDAVDSFAVLVILAIEIAWFVICSGDTFFVSAFNFLTFVNIYISISYISDTLTFHSNGVKYMIGYILIRTVIYGAIIPLLFKFFRPRFRRLVDALNKEWRVAALLPLIFLVLQICLLYYPNPYWVMGGNQWYKSLTVIVYVLFLAVYYLLNVQANAIVEKYSMEQRELLMAQQSKLWESELARQKSSVALASQQLHDMHHHNAVIMGMLQSGDMGGLKAYMQSFDAALDLHNANVYCSNPIVNSIMNACASRASAKGISTVFHVSLPEGIGIDNVDLTCIFGNALENALEGCLRLPKHDKKEIIVTAKFIDQRLRLQVENTCRSDVAFNGELPLTQKQGGGTGTKSILYTAERYDGTAGFSVKDGRFITQVVLNAM